MTLFLLKYWKYLVVILALLSAGYLAYEKVYSIGYGEASATYEKKIQKYELDLATRINNIEYLSTSISKDTKDSNDRFVKDMNNILLRIKDKPVFVIDNGKCKPSETFVITYNDLIKRANKNDTK